MIKTGNKLIIDTSYRLQTILRPILGFTHILLDETLDEELNPEQRELLERIYLSAKNWHMVIRNFVEFSCFSNKEFLYCQPFNLDECVKEAQNVLITKATQQNRRIICFIDESIPSIFVGDIRRLFQVLVNLLNYALDFSAESKDEIVLSVRRGVDSNSLSFTIDGLIIQPEHINSLFSFSSATRPNLTDWNERLTLALSKRLVEMMGGTFSYSEKGVVCFTVLQSISDLGTPCQHNLQLMGEHFIEPINLTYTMISMSAQLIKTPLSERTHDFAETIFSFATQLQSTINNLQDFYDLKNGQIVLKSDPFDLHQWIEHVIYFFAPQASAKELSIAYIIDAEVPKKVVGDALRLHQILYNLLDNALKFTHQGQITLFVDNISRSNKDECELYFAVQDTGIGIPPQDIDYLFTISRNMTSMPAKYQSKGLGLLINKELVELMGGQIGVESNTRAGSTFYFTVTL